MPENAHHSPELKELDVLSVGSATYDLLFAVGSHPGPNEKGSASALVKSGGGPAANAAMAVARLGGRSAFAGYLGRDPFGQYHFAELMEAGVDTRFVRRGLQTTSLSTILVKPNGERTVINFTEAESLSNAAFDLASCNPRTILFDGHEPALSLMLVEEARRNGIPTILDAGSVREGTRALAGLVDMLVASESFALNFTGRSDAHLALSDLAHLAGEVVITLGADGLIWQGSHGSGMLPAFAVDVVDTSGAGDAFHGAFALGLARDVPWPALLRYASGVAALCCTRLGARPGLPNSGQVRDFFDCLGQEPPF